MARKKPYTIIGVKRLKCFKCGKPALYQWQICSDNNIYRPLCPICDLNINILVIQFMQFDNELVLIGEYVEKITKQLSYYDYQYDVPELNYIARRNRSNV